MPRERMGLPLQDRVRRMTNAAFVEQDAGLG